MKPSRPSSAAVRKRFLTGLMRAFGGAVLFALPLLMTMEMWWFGFTVPRVRLLVLIAGMLPLLVVLARFSGFEKTSSLWQDTLDALTALGVGIMTSAFVLWLFGVLEVGLSLDETAGKIAVQAVPASFGAILANSQMGSDPADPERRGRKERAGYSTTLFYMGVGALFLAFNVAPTEEMILIAYMLTPVKALILVASSLLMMHAFVYAMEFRGMPDIPAGLRPSHLFYRYTVVGYVISLGVSAYVLWIFGRFDDGASSVAVFKIVVLGFPAALGAAAARLIL